MGLQRDRDWSSEEWGHSLVRTVKLRPAVIVCPKFEYKPTDSMALIGQLEAVGAIAIGKPNRDAFGPRGWGACSADLSGCGWAFNDFAAGWD